MTFKIKLTDGKGELVEETVAPNSIFAKIVLMDWFLRLQPGWNIQVEAINYETPYSYPSGSRTSIRQEHLGELECIPD